MAKLNSNIINYILTGCILLIFNPFSLSAQLSSLIPNGFGIEAGLGHNQLFWEAEDFSGSKRRNDRTEFSVMPSARIHYYHPVLSDIGVYTFIGYNEFGGRSKEDLLIEFTDVEVLYKDRYRIHNLETGVFGIYTISKIKAGLGTKINRHLAVTHRYHFENHPAGIDGWHTSDDNFFIGNWSVDGGFRIGYVNISGMILGAESWFGLSNLSDTNDFSMKIRQNHYRLFLGYRF